MLKKIHTKTRITLMVLILGCVTIVNAQNENSNPVFEGIETKILSSKYIGEDYNLIVGLPFGYNQSKAYQVLYVLDANVTFGMVNDISKLLSFEAKHPSVIVVGIAYKSAGDWMRKRGRDFMPNYSGILADKEVNKFHQFISQEVIPYIDENYKTKATENIIYGHSSAAVYGLYSLFTSPDLFKHYILTSPSVDEDTSFTSNLEVKYHSNSKMLDVNLYTCVATEDKASFVTVYSKFIDSLSQRNYEGLNMKNDVVSGTHMSSMSQAFINGFHFINGNKF